MDSPRDDDWFLERDAAAWQPLRVAASVASGLEFQMKRLMTGVQLER